MLDWMNLFKNDTLKYPEMVEIISSDMLNPETLRYYVDNEEDTRYCVK